VLRAVVLTQYRRVTDGQTDGIAVASTALAKRRAVKTTRNTLKYHLVTAEPPFTAKTIDWVHQTGPRKAA